MPRTARNTPGGGVYHVMNRSAGRVRMLKSQDDYLAFENVLIEAYKKHPIPILSYCLMEDHWQFVVWPKEDDQLTSFFRWLTHTHAMRWRVARGKVGQGPLYQGRFKTFPVQRDNGLELLCRHVERSALTGGLVTRAQDWRWGSLWVRKQGTSEQRSVLSGSGVDFAGDWSKRVNKAMTPDELELVKKSLQRSRPLGSETWVKSAARRLGLEHTLRPPGRPSALAKG